MLSLICIHSVALSKIWWLLGCFHIFSARGCVAISLSQMNNRVHAPGRSKLSTLSNSTICFCVWLKWMYSLQIRMVLGRWWMGLLWATKTCENGSDPSQGRPQITTKGKILKIWICNPYVYLFSGRTQTLTYLVGEHNVWPWGGELVEVTGGAEQHYHETLQGGVKKRKEKAA